jgi:hypothetical protein
MTKNAAYATRPVPSVPLGHLASPRAPAEAMTILTKLRASAWPAQGTGRIARAAARIGSGTAEMREAA